MVLARLMRDLNPWGETKRYPSRFYRYLGYVDYQHEVTFFGLIFQAMMNHAIRDAIIYLMLGAYRVTRNNL
jgi:hypothetical protein